MRAPPGAPRCSGVGPCLRAHSWLVLLPRPAHPPGAGGSRVQAPSAIELNAGAGGGPRRSRMRHRAVRGFWYQAQKYASPVAVVGRSPPKPFFMRAPIWGR